MEITNNNNNKVLTTNAKKFKRTNAICKLDVSESEENTLIEIFKVQNSLYEKYKEILISTKFLAVFKTRREIIQFLNDKIDLEAMGINTHPVRRMVAHSILNYCDGHFLNRQDLMDAADYDAKHIIRGLMNPDVIENKINLKFWAGEGNGFTLNVKDFPMFYHPCTSASILEKDGEYFTSISFLSNPSGKHWRSIGQRCIRSELKKLWKNKQIVDTEFCNEINTGYFMEEFFKKMLMTLSYEYIDNQWKNITPKSNDKNRWRTAARKLKREENAAKVSKQPVAAIQQSLPLFQTHTVSTSYSKMISVGKLKEFINGLPDSFKIELTEKSFKELLERYFTTV